MRYKVIGWVDSGDCAFPVHEYRTEPVERAIIEDIKTHGYCFGEDAHDRYCPVLNDGTRVIYSARSWGRVMGRAHDMYKGGYDYMNFYMDEFIKEEYRVYPETYVDESLIVSREQLRDTFEWPLGDEEFRAIKEGEQTVLLRLFDEKSKLLDIGDYIEFTSQGGRRIKMVVADLDVENTFRQLINTLEYDEKSGRFVTKLRFGPASLGFAQGSSEEDILRALRSKFSEDEEREFGAAAITVKKLSHACTTYLRLCVGESYDFITVGRALASLGGEWDRFASEYTAGVNEEYDVDVNNMIRKTIAAFVGREVELKRLVNSLNGELYIEIVPRICAGSDEPNQQLSLDDDIIEFLYKSGAKLDLDYYILT